METAYSVLNESFQQILASLARLVDPTVDTSKLFPSFSLNVQTITYSQTRTMESRPAYSGG